MPLHGHSGVTRKSVCPSLTISGDRIPPLEDNAFKFLGMPVRVYSSNDTARTYLEQMLTTIDESLMSLQQNLHLFKHGVCPRISWPLLVEVFLVSWLERELQPLATRGLKNWAGPVTSSNTSTLFLHAKKDGFFLFSLVRLHKKLQAMKMVQLFSPMTQEQGSG